MEQVLLLTATLGVPSGNTFDKEHVHSDKIKESLL